MTDSGNEIIEREEIDGGALSQITHGELDAGFSRASQKPRSITKFRKEVFELVTLSPDIADGCFYALPRDGKMVEGPSARFAEIVLNCWGNSRAGARVIDDRGDFITAQGVYSDLERNVSITFEVQRRITDKHGRRYKPDMIGVTGNAACSIALRNAILKGIPKALWVGMYEDARRTAAGDIKTLPTRRAQVFDALRKMGVTEEQVFAKLAIGGMDDVGLDEIQLLKGMMNAIREGDTTIEQAFAVDGGPEQTRATPMPKSKSAAQTEAPATVSGAVPPSPTAIIQNGDGVPVEEGGLSPEEQARFDAEVRGEPTPTKADPLAAQPATDTGELASEGERNWLLNRAKKRSILLVELLHGAGITNVASDSLRGLTKHQFDTLRANLL